MKLFILACIAFYVLTGIFISIKTFKHVAGQILGSIWFGIVWLPLLVADIVVKRNRVDV